MSGPARILYAPTWEGHYEEACYSSLFVLGRALIGALIAEPGRYVVHFKAHPLTGTVDARYAQTRDELADALRRSGSAGMVMVEDRTLYDYFLETDLLITDISSVISDFLYLERPLCVTNPLGLPDLAAQFPVVRGCYVLESDPSGVSDVIAQALDADPKREAREATRAHVFGVPRHGAMAALNAAIAQIAPGCLPSMLAKELDKMVDDLTLRWHGRSGTPRLPEPPGERYGPASPEGLLDEDDETDTDGAPDEDDGGGAQTSDVTLGA